MMKFKNFIEEKYINDTKEWQLMAKLAVPLSPSLLQELEVDIPKAYHVTDLKGFKNLLKLQGKRKDVACFTRGSEGISRGALTNGSILTEVSGKSSFMADKDFKSKLDRNGIRWIEAYGDVGGEEFSKDSIIFNKFSKIMEDKILHKYSIKKIEDMYNLLTDTMSGKEKGEFIKWYFDESKKIMNKSFIKDVRDTIKRFRGSPRNPYSNNELFIHDIKILNVFVIDTDNDWVDPESPDFDEFDKYINEPMQNLMDKLIKLGYKPSIVTGDFIKNIDI